MSQITHHALLFEVKSIQQYLFSSGKLRDIIGASELIDSLTGDILDKALDKLDQTDKRNIQFSRRAGGAFYAFSSELKSLVALRSLFTLLIQQIAPGLSFDVGTGSGKTSLQAFDEARKTLRENNAVIRSSLPLASPMAERNRRTGEAAVAFDRHDGAIDAATRSRKYFADLSTADFITRFSPPDAKLGWRDWPRSLDADQQEKDGGFPFNDNDHTVALIHADGNAFGQLLMNARTSVQDDPQKFLEVFTTLSNIIKDTTIEAARQAVNEVLIPAREQGRLLPARPILLGGDDLTILVRADLAIAFLRAFIKAFESISPQHLSKLTTAGMRSDDVPAKLTIGAGVVFMRASQPFYLASQLAESLMETAKQRARTLNSTVQQSSVAFHRVTSSLSVSHADIIKNEQTHRSNGIDYVDTLGSYFIGENAPSPHIDDLMAMVELLSDKKMASGPTRQLLTLIGLSHADAQTLYRRWRTLMSENKPDKLAIFDGLLNNLLVGKLIQDLPYEMKDDITAQSPLGDAVALKSITATGFSMTDKENAV